MSQVRPLSELKLVELKEKAKSIGLDGCEAMKSKAEVVSAIENFNKSSNGSNEKSVESKKPVENSGQKSHAKVIEKNDDLQNHPKFSKFKPSGEN